MAASNSTTPRTTCYHCQNPPRPGKTTCQRCTDRAKANKAARLARYALAGLCRCGKAPAVDRQFCEPCLVRFRNHTAKANAKRRAVIGGCQWCSRRATLGYRSCDRCRALKLVRAKAMIRTQRAKVFAGYGGKCVCCGEATQQFLTVDHINGGGSQHRRKAKLNGSRFYAWIIKNNFPADLRLLCYNCNCGRHMNGGVCPHEMKSE